MASAELDSFIEQQRAKLREERANIRSEVSNRGNGTSLAIPDHESRREQLRNERKREYQQLLTSKTKSSSIAETRRKLAEEREADLLNTRHRLNSRELGHSERPKHDKPPRRDETYSEMRERKRREEKQYRAGQMDYSPEQSSPRGRTVSFAPPNHQDREGGRQKWAESGIHVPGRRQWEDEEDQHMQWARDRGRYISTPRDRHVNTPPDKLFTGKDEDESGRSKSAPSVRTPDFMNFGKRSTEDEMKAKKQAYAEELRRQMMEKDEAKAKEKAEKFGYLSSKKEEEKPQSKDRKGRTNRRSGAESPSHSRYSSPGPPHDRTREVPSQHHAPAPSQPLSGNPPHPAHPYPHFGYMPQPVPYPAAHPYSYYYPPPPQPGALLPPPHPHHPPHPHPPPHPYYGQYNGRYGGPESPPKKHSSVRIRTPSEDSLPSGNRKPIQTPLKDNSNDGTSLRVSPRDPHGKDAYREELERQIIEKKQKQLQDHAKREDLDRKKEEEIKLYNPWGKGGAGAPIRDATGKPITDLRKLRKGNDTKGSPRSVMEGDFNSSFELHEKRDPSRLGSHSPYETGFNLQQEPDQKSQQEEYRKELMRQMEEKEKVKRKEKEKQQLEEEREVQRLEMERKKLQDDFEREQQKQKEKEEETKAKNDLLKKAAEEKRLAERETARQLQEQESRELEMARRQEAQQRYERPPSPPVPAVKSQLIQQGQPVPARHSTTPARSSYPAAPQYVPQARGSSPPVPALRKKETGGQNFNYTSNLQVTDGPVSQPVHRDQTLISEHARSVVIQEPVVYPQQPQLQPARELEQPAVSQVVKKQISQVDVQFDSEPKHLESDRDHEVLERLSAMRRLLKDAKSRAPTAAASTAATEGKRTSERAPGLQGPVRVDARKLSTRTRSVHTETQQDPIDTFNQLKYGSKPASLRREFLVKFPEPPRSGSSLEVQQAELLRHQEDILSKLQAAARHPCQPSQEAKPRGDLLPSESVYVEHNPSRESRHARRSARRRTWQISAKFGSNSGGSSDGGGGGGSGVGIGGGSSGISVGGGGGGGGGGSGSTIGQYSALRPISQSSTASFDLDAVTERNRDRLQQLDKVLKSSQSSASRSPDDVIQNFLDSSTPYASQLSSAETLSRVPEQSLPSDTTFKPVFP